MPKTRDMEWAEHKLGGPLEETLPPLYEELRTHEAVAGRIGIHRATLLDWLDLLGAEREHSLQHITVVTFPDYPPAS